MSSKLFISRGCNYCNTATLASALFNCEAGLRNQLEVVQTKSSNPDLFRMQAIFKEDWVTPALVVEKEVMGKKFGGWQKKQELKAIIVGTMDAEYNFHFLKEFLDIP